MGWKITLFSWELELRSGVAVLIKNDVGPLRALSYSEGGN